MSRQLFYNGRVYRDHRFETLCVLSENGVITGSENGFMLLRQSALI